LGGQPGDDFPPRVGRAALPRFHAALVDHELRELIARDGFDEAREIGARAAKLEKQIGRGRFCRRRCSGRGISDSNPTACN
jgi:hypothetical protein